MDKDILLSDVDLKNLYHKMLDYLSRGDMSEKRLIKRIERLRLRYPAYDRYRNYTKDNCIRVIALLREEGYLNERKYAENLFQQLRDRYDGMRVIRQKLLRRDIAVEIVDEVFRSHEQDEHQDLTKISNRARAKFEKLKATEKDHPMRTQRIRQKLYSWLSLRGFNADEVRQILDDVMSVEN